jgi:hypothetical protein
LDRGVSSVGGVLWNDLTEIYKGFGSVTVTWLFECADFDWVLIVWRFCDGNEMGGSCPFSVWYGAFAVWGLWCELGGLCLSVEKQLFFLC